MHALLLAALLAPSPARAQNVPLQWGVGATLGTMLVPIRYPLAFPKAVSDDQPFEKVRGDVSPGLEALYWADERSRLALELGSGFGSGYRALRVLVRYDRITPSDALDWFYGGGLGVGRSSFSDDDGRSLVMTTFPARVELGSMVRLPSVAFQGSIFAQYDIPGLSTYTDAEGKSDEVGWGFYGSLGVELAVYFGQFNG